MQHHESRTIPLSSLALLVPLVLSILGLVACQPRQEQASDPPELVAEDVGPTLEISIEDDIQAAPRKEGLVGVMPAAFPKDLPVHLPSSLVDLGDGENGPWVELLSSDRRKEVQASLRQELGRAGWSITERGDAVWLLEKGGRRARLDIGEDGAGTLYRYEF